MRAIIISFIFSVLSAGVSFAQIRLGPFLAYGEELGLWGLGAHAEVALNEKMSLSPVFTQYFPEDLDENRRSAWELNANLNYYVITGDVGYLYGLAGLNFTHIKTKTPVLGSTELVDKDGNVGLNLGIGTMFRLTDVSYPFAEAKYVVGSYSQFAVFVGVKFQLGESPL